MKINEVEQLVGVTKRNIRFYEKEGLLAPDRDSGNGYRDYTDADVAVLRQIKLLRKLDLPLEEIRLVQSGDLTLRDAMERHVIVLERRRANLAAMTELCGEVAADGASLAELDTQRYLAAMEEKEKEGTAFVNIRKKDARVKYVAPVVAAVVTVALMAALIVALLAEAGQMPFGLAVVVVALPAAVICGVVAALIQRLKQIKGGEEDAAAQY